MVKLTSQHVQKPRPRTHIVRGLFDQLLRVFACPRILNVNNFQNLKRISRTSEHRNILFSFYNKKRFFRRLFFLSHSQSFFIELFLISTHTESKLIAIELMQRRKGEKAEKTIHFFDSKFALRSVLAM